MEQKRKRNSFCCLLLKPFRCNKMQNRKEKTFCQTSNDCQTYTCMQTPTHIQPCIHSHIVSTKKQTGNLPPDINWGNTLTRACEFDHDSFFVFQKYYVLYCIHVFYIFTQTFNVNTSLKVRIHLSCDKSHFLFLQNRYKRHYK